MKDPEVGRFRKTIFELFRPRVNFGGKQKVDQQNFVPEGHPREQSLTIWGGRNREKNQRPFSMKKRKAFLILGASKLAVNSLSLQCKDRAVDPLPPSIFTAEFTT